jgi:hypothetical protein
MNNRIIISKGELKNQVDLLTESIDENTFTREQYESYHSLLNLLCALEMSSIGETEVELVE